MNRSSLTLLAVSLLLGCSTAHLLAHDSAAESSPVEAGSVLKVIPLPIEPADTGPVASPPVAISGRPTTGRGYWTFQALTSGVLPLPQPAKAAQRGAHGTLVIDQDRDIVYWGLEKVGWVCFGDRLTRSWIPAADPVFAQGNLHGADLHPRPGELPLIAVADNVDGEIYLSDTSFNQPEILGWPNQAPYGKKEEYHPTDVAFVDSETIASTDGYGAAYFTLLNAQPLSYRGKFHGGKGISKTPHGVTIDPDGRSLILSARPEGELKRWEVETTAWTEFLGLPKGSTVCDIDIMGDYALAPCLNGPDNTPGPIYVVDLKKRVILSILRPKQDLGFADAQHIHDAAWYETMVDGKNELYVLFTNWNPGGIGAMRLITR